MSVWWKVVPYMPFIVLAVAVLVAAYHVVFYW